MQAWVMLGVGSASGEKKKQNQQKRIGNEEPTEMAALGPGKVSMGNGKNIKEQKERQKDSAMIWCNPPLSLLERERELLLSLLVSDSPTNFVCFAVHLQARQVGITCSSLIMS